MTMMEDPTLTNDALRRMIRKAMAHAGGTGTAAPTRRGPGGATPAGARR
jgi:hypothetical protein